MNYVNEVAPSEPMSINEGSLLVICDPTIIEKYDSFKAGEAQVKSLYIKGAWVTERFLNEVRDHVRKTIPELTFDQRYTAEKLCGTKYWDQQKTAGQHIIIGKCIRYLADNKHLPLELSGRTDTNAKIYRRI